MHLGNVKGCSLQMRECINSPGNVLTVYSLLLDLNMCYSLCRSVPQESVIETSKITTIVWEYNSMN